MVDFLNSSGITERGQDVLQVHCDGGGHANNLTRGTSTFVGSGEELVHVSVSDPGPNGVSFFLVVFRRANTEVCLGICQLYLKWYAVSRKKEALPVLADGC